MIAIMSEGEAMRRAIKWISGELREAPNESLQVLVNDAVSRFDFSPREADFLTEFHRKDKMDGH